MNSNYFPHERVYAELDSEVRTKQSFADETNINTIMLKWNRTGSIEHMNKRQGQYGDFSDAPDYHETFLRIQDANLAFDALPSEVRKRMHNDPGELMDFLADPENRDEAIELGLIDPPAPAPDPVPLAAAAAPTPADPVSAAAPAGEGEAPTS